MSGDQDAGGIVLGGVHGQANIGWQVRPLGASGGVTCLRDLHQVAPLRVLFPDPSAEDIAIGVIVTTSGGLVGGDRLTISVTADPDTASLVTAQAAEKVYRSTGADCDITVDLTAGHCAWLEWLPQETILFNGARLRRATRIDAAPGSRVLAGEIVVFGRRASGETMDHGMLRDLWTIRRAGQLVWADVLRIEEEFVRVLAAPAGFAGAAASATIVYVADDPAPLLAAARSALPVQDDPALRAAAGIVNGVLVVRLLAADPFVLRGAFGQFWALFRAAAGSCPGRLPVLWNC